MKNPVPTLAMPTAEEAPVEAEAEAEGVMVAAAEADVAIDAPIPKIVVF